MTKKEFQIQEIMSEVIQEIQDTKGVDLKVLDIRKVVSFTDYFVIVTGTSDRHVQALADRVHLRLKKDFEMLPLTYEGLEKGQWVLLDYGDFVLHVFQPDYREYYSLEEFWSNAPVLGADDFNSPTSQAAAPN